MEDGSNVVMFAKKEQCLSLGVQLRDFFKITNYKIFRGFPNGEIEYLHPKDGVFPEKASLGRTFFGHNSGTVGCNVEPVSVKFKLFDTYTRDSTVLPEAECTELLSRMCLIGST
jgi:photosystem I subunit 2